ncbi:DUF3103 family protein [Sphaerisporangium sp. NPDC049002]|uniref:DUF3103 family protein n=1 Tax=unclassified Sphaerisporangium TaxID=2630420 RepID=UPI0033D963C8
MKKFTGLAALAMATALIGSIAPTSAEAAPTRGPEQPVASSAPNRAATMDGYKRALAQQVARRLDDPAFRGTITRDLADDGQADLASLFASVAGAGDVADYTRRANGDILRLKGLDATNESLLQVRTDPATAKRVAAGDKALVMFTPSVDEKALRTVTAYDSAGRAHEIDAFRAPARPVLIVGLDESKVATLSREALRRKLTEAGISGTDRTDNTAAPSASAAVRPLGQIRRIANYNDHEPWYKGSPEIYAWVAGAGVDGAARVDTVEMPYIKTEGVIYSPNQILIDWSAFKWSAVDVVFMERDDNADLSGLVKAVVEGALVISGNGSYVSVADKIVGALPSDWTIDTDDWVDSCYAITRVMAAPQCAAIPKGMGLGMSLVYL